LTLLSTAGVLGETYIDIDSSQSRGPQAAEGDVLPSREIPDFSDMVRSGQGTLQNLDALLKRLDRIIAFVESGQGSVGKLIYDPTLYDNANATIANAKKLTDDVNAGKGAIGKLAKDEEFARKLQDTMNKLSDLTTRLDAGEGTAGKLLRDPALYNNADQMLIEI